MLPEDIRHELRKFAETTGIKGVSRIAKATTKVTRFFWLAAITFCSCFLLYQLYNILGNYLSHSVTRVTKVNHNTPIFPDVTICNLFPASNLRTKSYDDYLKRLGIVRNLAKKNNLDLRDDIWGFLRSIEYYNTNSPILNTFYTTEDDFLVECRQYGWDLYIPALCSARPVLILPLQKCHRIELDWSNGTVAAVSLILYVNNFFPIPIDNYNSWLRMSTGTGVRVMIHPRFTYPNPKTAIRASTGSELFVQLQQTNVTRLPAPYGNCETRDPFHLAENRTFLYTGRTCTSLCRQKQTVSKCGCMDNNEMFSAADLVGINNTFCSNISEIKVGDKDSLKRHIGGLSCFANFFPNDSRCDCPVSCSETEYGVTVSSSKWPNPLYQLSFYKHMIQNKSQYGTKFSVYEDILKNAENQSNEELIGTIKKLHLIEDNFVRVTIIFSGETYKVSTDTGSFTWDTLVANLGGTFNLWLGICVPTFAEIIELLYSILMAMFREKKVESKVVNVAPAKDIRTVF